MESVAQASRHMLTAVLIVAAVWAQGFVLFRVLDFVARRRRKER